MNLVLVMTDTQNKSMVGAYGNPSVDTPNLDRLAATGIRFERAYTACPLCTPARSAIFSGLHPSVNGAWCNNVAPGTNIPLMGAIFRHYGYRAAYTGKWHLDGAGYFGDGVAGGGFEPEWWYDGQRYAEEIGPEMFRLYRSCRSADDLRRAGFTEDNIWGHRVANRAIDFIQRVGSQPFLLVVSFDEPHGPCIAPPEYWERFDPGDIPQPPNYNAPLAGKPEIQCIQRRQHGEVEWPQFAASATRFFGCNSYIDREIGRIIDAVEQIHGEDTTIIYTSDHGDMLGAHGLRGKGPMMYEETTNVPFIVRLPGSSTGAASESLVSHLDILPTLLDLAGIKPPPSLQGVSLRPVLDDPRAEVREHATISFTRYAINHDDWGEFYPIRCLVDERYKLVINLFETDELYDLENDPHELRNLIEEPECAAVRDHLHDALLAEMDRVRDPFRSYRWGARLWRKARSAFYYGGKRRNRPQGFPFEPASLEADGTWVNN